MCLSVTVLPWVALAVRGLDLVFSCQLQFILLFLYLLMTLTFTHCLSGSNSSGSEKWFWQQPNVYQPSPTVTEKRRRKIRYEVSIGTVGWESSTVVQLPSRFSSCNFSFVVETIVKSVSTLTDVYFNVLSPTGSWAIKWEFLFKKRKKKEANVISQYSASLIQRNVSKYLEV